MAALDLLLMVGAPLERGEGAVLAWIGRPLLSALLLLTPLAPVNAQHGVHEISASDENEPASYRVYQRKGSIPAIRYRSPAEIEQERISNLALERACEAGDLEICNALGKAYANGENAPQNRPVAAELFYHACIGGFGDGCTNLGSLYEIAVDDLGWADAVMAHEQACVLGSALGCRRYAGVLDRGPAQGGDPERAAAMMRWACEHNDAEACRRAANMRMRSGRETENWWTGLAELERLCGAGDMQACRDGSYATRSEDGRYDASQLKFYSLHCEIGEVEVCLDLGRLTLMDLGPGGGLDAALVYFDRACELSRQRCLASQAVRAERDDWQPCADGDWEACTRLGFAYGAGSPIRDFNKEEAYFVRACEGGQPAACGEAARLLYQGPWEPAGERAIRATGYIQRGCNGGDSQSCLLLANHLMRGEVIEQDIDRSVLLYQEQCAAGEDKACVTLESIAGLEPEAPLVEAGDRFVPPIERDENGWPIGDWLPEQTRQALAPPCVRTTVEFRGQSYTDTICRSADYAIGSYRMRPGAAPWQALLWRPARIGEIDVGPAQRVKCGGSVIKAGWILTAAHCLTDQNRSIRNRGYRIRLGVYNPREEEGVSYPIRAVYPHPNYNPRTYAYDIALIRYDTRKGRVDGPTNSIATIKLDPQSTNARTIVQGSSVYSYGWGWTQASRGTSTNYLQGVKMFTESPQACESLTGYRAGSDIALCAVGRDGAQSCKGDSGGPLITYSDPGRRPTLIGVVSWGQACGTEGAASAFARVAKVKGWIDRKTRSGR